MAQAQGRLLSVWGRSGNTGTSACTAFATSEGLLWAELPLTGADERYPDLSATFACATRLQRSLADLGGRLAGLIVRRLRAPASGPRAEHELSVSLGDESLMVRADPVRLSAMGDVVQTLVHELQYPATTDARRLATEFGVDSALHDGKDLPFSRIGRRLAERHGFLRGGAVRRGVNGHGVAGAGEFDRHTAAQPA